MGRQLLAWAALMGVCAAGTVFVHRIVHRPALEDLFIEGSKVVPVAAEELSRPVCTDKQRPIHLFRLSPLRELPSQQILDERADVEQRLKLIRTAPSDQPCNCYGWIFANGEYWLAWQDAEAILEDNGYAKVLKPKPDDLVAYKNQYGVLIHVGIVRSVDSGVEVESQWGEMGRYRHAVDNQVFSEYYGYYRSKRRGHLLVGLGREPQPSQQTEEKAEHDSGSGR
jgi:hypothetical protein